MKTVAVIEGFSGGPLHTRRFRKALVEAGFEITNNRAAADIIVAHSAGIYGIPLEARAHLLMLIGPTYWPGVRLIKRSFRHARSSGRYHLSNFGLWFYLRKKLLEIYYFFRRNKYMWLGIKHNNRLNKLNKLIEKPGRRTIIIRNQDDPFTSPQLRNKIKSEKVKFVELPGVHDHFAENPQHYIELLLKEI
ncbi:MAG: hypothetical protein ACREGG_04520 [Candidatus Saccharimonadales bacterium]